MIAFALALLAATPLSDVAGGDEARFAACTSLIRSDKTAAVTEAEAWAARSNTVPARQCLGLAYVATERWSPAAIAFAQAATAAEQAGDARAAGLWTQAGNAALAGEDPSVARTNLDRALSSPALSPAMRGEAWFDRARADVALGNNAAARTDLDNGLALVPADPFGWLLSATLARRQNDLPRAAKDIAEATRLAPDDAAVAVEAGNIFSLSGQADAATRAWTRAAQIAPASAEGRAAAAALAGK